MVQVRRDQRVVAFEAITGNRQPRRSNRRPITPGVAAFALFR